MKFWILSRYTTRVELREQLKNCEQVSVSRSWSETHHRLHNCYFVDSTTIEQNFFSSPTSINSENKKKLRRHDMIKVKFSISSQQQWAALCSELSAGASNIVKVNGELICSIRGLVGGIITQLVNFMHANSELPLDFVSPITHGRCTFMLTRCAMKIIRSRIWRRIEKLRNYRWQRRRCRANLAGVSCEASSLFYNLYNAVNFSK